MAIRFEDKNDSDKKDSDKPKARAPVRPASIEDHVAEAEETKLPFAKAVRPGKKKKGR